MRYQQRKNFKFVALHVVSHNSLVFCNNWGYVLSTGLGSSHFTTFEQCDFAYSVLLSPSELDFLILKIELTVKPTSRGFWALNLMRRIKTPLMLKIHMLLLTVCNIPLKMVLNVNPHYETIKSYKTFVLNKQLLEIIREHILCHYFARRQSVLWRKNTQNPNRTVLVLGLFSDLYPTSAPSCPITGHVLQISEQTEALLRGWRQEEEWSQGIFLFPLLQSGIG